MERVDCSDLGMADWAGFGQGEPMRHIFGQGFGQVLGKVNGCDIF